MRISDWSSDVCSSDLFQGVPASDELKRDLAAVAATLAHAEASRAVRIDGQLDGPIHVCRDWAVRLYDTYYQVRVDADHVEVDGKGVVVDAAWQAGQRLVMAVNEGSPIAQTGESTRGDRKSVG